MAISLVLREGPSGKGAPLTNQEVDNNFVNLKDSIVEEKNSRESAITDINDIIEGLQSDISTETTSRENADQSLQTQINDIQDAIGSQTFVDISGDTMSGNLEFNDSSNSTESPKIEFSAGTDSASIHFISSGEGSETSGKSRSNLVFSLLNEGDEGVLVRTTNSLNQSVDIFYVNTNLLEYKNNKIWHAGNDGAESGLDADTLDGLQATAFASSVHNHDDLYYTKTQIDSTLSTFYTKTESDLNFAPVVHNHDDLYYTKSEINTSFASISHNHDDLYAPLIHTHDYQPLSQTLIGISELDGAGLTTGFIKRVVVDGVVTWEISTSDSSIQTEYQNGSLTTTQQVSPNGEQISLDQFSTSDFRSVKYMIQATTESDFHVTEVMILQNNTEAFITEFGTLTSNGPLISVAPQVDSVSGICTILVTPISSVNTTIKAMRYSLFA